MATWWNKSSSEDSELFTSSEEERNEAPIEQGMGANPFLDGNDSDEDEEKRVVKTAKEKRFEELLKSVKVVKTAMTLNDWIKVNESMSLFFLM
jgi:translation initiation factor 3 subunit C